jgi:agmatinase
MPSSNHRTGPVSPDGDDHRSTPTFAAPSAFLGLTDRPPDSPIRIVGVPLDLGTSNRAGARFGPSAIRSASRMLIDGIHPELWVDPASLPLTDAGDCRIALGDIPSSLELIERQVRDIPHIVALGGDHSISLALLRALASRLGPVALIHVDAHIDTWPTSFGQPFGHGSPFRHAIEEGLVDPERMVQIGIRSPMQRSVFDWTRGRGVTIVPAMQVHEHGPEACAATVRRVVGEAPVYLSVDIDALDPAFAPGTGTPEAGGLCTWQVQAILRRLVGLSWVGMDVVEVSPPYDLAEITALAAATIVWEYLSLLAAAHRPGDVF